MATLRIKFDLVIGGQKKPYEFVLKEGRSYRVGRQAEWLSIPDPALSRYHFELRVQKNTVRAADLTSTNGLFLNGLKLKEAPIKSGDVLEFGACRIEIVTVATEGALPKASSGAPAQALIQRAQDENLLPTVSPLRNSATFFRLAWRKPAQLFREANYRQPLRDSYLLILGSAVVHWVLGNARHLLANPVRIFAQTFFFAMGVLMLATVFSLLMKILREKLEIEGTFHQFLALFAYAYLIFLPIHLVCTVFPGFLMLGWLAFSAFMLFAAIESIQAPLKRLVPVFFISWMVALIPAFVLISLVL